MLPPSTTSPRSPTSAGSARTTRTPGTAVPGCWRCATAWAARPAAMSRRAPPSRSSGGSTSGRPTTCSARLPAPCTGPTTGSVSWSRRIPRSTAPAPPRPSRSSTGSGSAWGTSATAAPTCSAGGDISQLTKDHTFVQTLIDEGRITEEEARVHPHRNLILRALDGVRDDEPDLFTVELEPATGCCSAATARAGSSTTAGWPTSWRRQRRLRRGRAGPRQPRGRQQRQRHLRGRRRGRRRSGRTRRPRPDPGRRRGRPQAQARGR